MCENKVVGSNIPTLGISNLVIITRATANMQVHLFFLSNMQGHVINVILKKLFRSGNLLVSRHPYRKNILGFCCR